MIQKKTNNYWNSKVWLLAVRKLIASHLELHVYNLSPQKHEEEIIYWYSSSEV